MKFSGSYCKREAVISVGDRDSLQLLLTLNFRSSQALGLQL